MRASSLRLCGRLSTSVILTLILTTFLNGPPGALVLPGPRNAEAASPSAKPTSATAKLNLFNPASRKSSGPQVKSLTAPASGQGIGPLPKPLLHPVRLPMQPALLKLDPITPGRFQGSDGRLEIDVPAGAVTATDLATAGGELSLSVRQIAPASGGTGGGSGRYSFGTYLIQTITGQKHEWMQQLRKPLTFKLHISPEEYAVDVQHAVLVFNGEFPADTNFNPDGSGPMISAAQAHLTPASAVNAALDANKGLLTATVFMPADPVAAFNTDSPVATFGKPDVFSADLSAGALSGGYPIDLPAGPAGFKPPLTLTYSSAAVNEQHNPQGAAGWVGEGWSLSLGSISWAEHNVAESVGTNWENSWMLNDAFGTSAELIPPNTGVTTFCGIGTNLAPTAPPVVWHTAPENHAKVIEIAGSSSLTCGGAARTLPCFRAFLPNGVMEEFGCTQYSVQWYPLANGAYAVNQWFLDLIQDPKGNQIRINYGNDLVSTNHNYPRDVVISSIEWGSPTCTASSCALKRVAFDASFSVAHTAGATCVGGGTPRCDDPQDLSGSGGMAAPLIQNTLVLNDVRVQVRSASDPTPWNTLRDYQLSYEQTGPGQIRDPATGLLESVAGHLTLTQVTAIGSDGGQLPTRSFGYQLVTNYYEDSANYAASASYCPSWVPNGKLCSQSYGGNSYYLASATNGLGLSQSFSWSLARNNTYVGLTDPLYCNTTTANNCTLADDQNWSRVVLTSETDSTAGTTASTTTYSYALANFVAQACPQCTVGYTWGNQKDGDYSDYYNGKFMGFAQVTVTRPDFSVETHYFHSSLGWGVYNCQAPIGSDPNALNCTAGPSTYCYYTCHPDAWWMGATVNSRLTFNALHGHEQEVDFYDKRSSSTDPLVLLRKTVTSYLFNGAFTGCLPSGITPSPPTSWGTWDGQLVSELDPSNPVALCDLQTQTVTSSTYDGTNPTAVPQAATTYAYDLYGRVTSATLTSSNGTNGSATTIVHNPTYMTADSVSGTCTDPSSCHYLIDFENFNDTEDGAGGKKACIYTTYDTSYLAEVMRVDRYTDCGQLDSAHQISTVYAYDSYGNRTGTRDPDGVAGNTAHTACAAVGGSGSYSRCSGLDGTFHALPVSSAVSTTSSQTLATSTAYQASVGFGQWPASTTDPNGQTTSYNYDGLGRLTSLTVPPIGSESGQQTISTTAYSAWCAGTAANVPCIEVDQNQRPGSESGGTYVPLTATRICDTRSGSGTPCAGQTLAANATLNLQVAGQGGVPSSGAVAVVLNVTLTNTSAIGNLIVYPTGSGQPSTSNINFAAGQTIANLVQVPLGSSGQVAFNSYGSATDLIVDVQGYVAQIASGTAGLMNPLTPSSRICDTRPGSGSPCAGRTIGANGSLNIQVTGQGGIPSSGVQAVVMNVVVTNTAAAGAATLYPAGQALPGTTNLNWLAGQTLANRVVVPVGTAGQVTITNRSGGSTDFIVDVFAWTADGSNPSAPGSEYGALIASRVCDTRAGSGTQCAGQTVGSGATLTIQVAGLAGVPSTSSANPPTAVDVNVTVTGAAVAGYLTIYPNQAARPSTSDLNFTAGQTLANRDVAVALGSDGKLAITNGGGSPVDVIVDVGGYYAPGPAGMAISRAFYDGWGHLVETRTFATNNQDVVRYAKYDAMGRLSFQSVPFFVPAYEGLPGFPAYYVPDVRPGTSNSYDGLGRLTSTTDALSNTTTNSISVACSIAGTNDTGCYEQILTVDPNRHQQSGLIDAMGRRAYIQRFTGSSAGTYAVYATAKYQYDYNGNLFAIVQPDGSVSTFTFDMAGRKISQGDPDSGQSTYSYDQDGNLIQSIDGRQTPSGTVNTSYDGLDRPLSRSTPVPSATSPTTFVTYGYDGGTNGKGRLTSKTFSGAPNNSLSGSYAYTYDARGQEANRTLTVAGGCAAGCSVGTTYDDARKVVTQTYPTNEVVTNTYDNAGWLNQVNTSQGNTTLLTNPGYLSTDYGAPAGLITSASFANGIVATWSHDALLRLTGSDLRGVCAPICPASPIFVDGRTFDAAGNVTSVRTQLGASIDIQGFCYDEQDRLVWAGSTGTPPTGCQLPVTPSSFGSAGYQRSYSYDSLGRLTSGALGTYSYGDPTHHLHAATAIGSAWTAGYDPAGNMTCRAPSSATTCAGTPTGAQLGYAADGSLSTWQNAPTNPTATTSFLYDGDGNRVAQQSIQNGTITTNVYVGNVEQLVTSGSTTTTQTYYYANGLRFAIAVNGVFSFLGGDAVGSVETATTSPFPSYALFDPYGQVRYSSGTMPTDYGFTGQHTDSATGLDYYNARYYDPVAGQFTSADSILPGNGYHVFGLSRYAYVEGNPEVRTDPSGLSGNPLCEGRCDRPDDTNSPTPAQIAPGLREDARTPGTKTLNPCAYGMEDTGCDADMGMRMGYYSGMGPEEWRCKQDAECSQGMSDISGIGLFFVPGPDAVVGALGIGKGLSFIGERAIGFFAKLFGRGGTKAVEGAGSSLAKGWRGTNRSTEESFAYHYKKHGAGRSPEQYAQDARNWANNPTGVGKPVPLADGSMGTVYRTPGGGPGGILDSGGNVVSFWYR